MLPGNEVAGDGELEPRRAPPAFPSGRPRFSKDEAACATAAAAVGGHSAGDASAGLLAWIRRALDRMVQIGLFGALPVDIRKRVRLCNVLALWGTAIMGPGSPSSCCSARRATAAEIASLVGFLAVLSLNAARAHRAARLLLIAIANGCVLAGALLFDEKAGGTLPFFALAALPLLLFGPNERRMMVAGWPSRSSCSSPVKPGRPTGCSGSGRCRRPPGGSPPTSSRRSPAGYGAANAEGSRKKLPRSSVITFPSFSRACNNRRTHTCWPDNQRRWSTCRRCSRCPTDQYWQVNSRPMAYRWAPSARIASQGRSTSCRTGDSRAHSTERGSGRGRFHWRNSTLPLEANPPVRL